MFPGLCPLIRLLEYKCLLSPGGEVEASLISLIVQHCSLTCLRQG